MRSLSLLSLTTLGLFRAALAAPPASSLPPGAPAAALAPVAAAAPAPTDPAGVVPEGWCVPVADLPYSDFAKAASVAQRAQALGFPAGVFDTRAFRNLAWGELVVIAQGYAGPDAKEQAVVAVRALKKARCAAYAKPCQPLSRAPAAPLASADNLPPLPVLSSRRVSLADLGEGCFAWSLRLQTAACLTGSDNSGTGSHWELLAVAIIDSDRVLAEHNPAKAAAGAIDQKLSDGGFVALTGLARPLAPGATHHSAAPRFSARWLRRQTSRGGNNSAPTYQDRILVRCGGPFGKEITAFEVDGAHEDPSALLYPIPAGSGGAKAAPAVLIIATRFALADEGEYGHSVDARTIDLRTCE